MTLVLSTEIKKIYNLLEELSEKRSDLGSLEILEFNKGEFLFQEGEIPKGVYLIISGKIKFTQNSKSLRPALLYLFGSGEFVGYSTLLRGEQYIKTGEVLEKCRVVFFPKALFFEAFEEIHGFMRIFASLICKRLDMAESAIVDLKTKDVRQRLASVLLKICEADESMQSKRIMMSRKDLAAIVGITPETLSRQLSRFISDGLITVRQKEILLSDSDELERISSSNES